jgi:hypothetical protein
MSDYTKTTNFTLKDSTNATILGADFETEFSAVANASTTKANKVGGAVSGNLASLSGTGDVQDSGKKASKVAQLDSVMTFEKSAVFDAEYDTGTGGSATITWDNGNKQKRTLTSNATLTFTAPSGPCNLILKIVNSGASRAITFPASVKWPDSTQPTESGAGKTDVYSFYYDGTNYYGAASLNY